LATKELRVEIWHQNMRDEIRRNVLEQYMAGRGGKGPLTVKERGSLGGMCKEQYTYLDRFAAEIAKGNLTEGQIRRRAEMYINSAGEAYERAQRRATEGTSLNEVSWVMDPPKEHCTGDPGCTELAALGWQNREPWPFRVGGDQIYPKQGRTPCLTNCGCTIHYRASRRKR